MRSLATEAVKGGKIHLNGKRTKPAKQVKVNDTLHVRKAETEFTIEVLIISDQRQSAKAARLLYEETAESLALRERQREARRLIADSSLSPHKRPDKRQRRRIHHFRNIRERVGLE